MELSITCITFAGKAIKDVPREQVVIASKWGPMLDEKHNFSFSGSAEYARKALQISLKDLGIGYIDLLILRSKERNTPIEESVRGMAVSTFSVSANYLN